MINEGMLFDDGENRPPELPEHLSYHPSKECPLRILVRIPRPGKKEYARKSVRIADYTNIYEVIEVAKAARDELILSYWGEDGLPAPQRRSEIAEKYAPPKHVYILKYTKRNGRPGTRVQAVVPQGENKKPAVRTFEVGRKWTIHTALEQATEFASEKRVELEKCG